MVRGSTIDIEEPPGADTVDDGEHRDDLVFAREYPALRRFAAATAPDGTDPDDLVQEAVARTIRRQPLCSLDNPAAYLRRAIVNLASNQRRTLSRGRAALTRLGHDVTADPQYQADLADLMRLPPLTRAVLYLVEVEDWTYAAVAEQLGLTEEAARAAASRARRRLRADIEEEQR